MGGLGRPGNLVRGMAILEREGVESVSCDGNEFHIRMKSGEYKDVSTDDEKFAGFYLNNDRKSENRTTFNGGKIMEPTTFKVNLPVKVILVKCDNCGKLLTTLEDTVWCSDDGESKCCSPQCLLEYLGEDNSMTLQRYIELGW